MWSAQTPPDAASTLFRLDERVALVTGASRGLGLEMAVALASAGATVLVNSRDEAQAKRIAAELCDAGLKGESLPFDPADEAAVVAAMALIEKRHGHLDVLLANAAARMRRDLAAIPPADFRALVETNLSSVYSLCWHALPLLKAAGRGRIVLVSSISARRAPPHDAAYSTTKAGLEGLMRALAVEAGRMGITCNAIAPGPFRTEVNRKAAEEMGGVIAQKVPLGGFAEPTELAGTALFLASDASSFVNGITLTVDGGSMAQL
ncbi:SDR family oxidoreductase [Novosphingobium sp. G106]|uniref:SDR family NAD(P)-dependent oxidoreductase n=1 Tax=Novosphingobium sp. G106 TaxID=2849500 RepID=UPI001C2CFD50|nr:SDR family oxidoreductase [Novosphingobium sp. G106]MBV1688914.1 SDR family oxidoreductase [Novosphingobium sp. G106]